MIFVINNLKYDTDKMEADARRAIPADKIKTGSKED